MYIYVHPDTSTWSNLPTCPSWLKAPVQGMMRNAFHFPALSWYFFSSEEPEKSLSHMKQTSLNHFMAKHGQLEQKGMNHSD